MPSDISLSAEEKNRYSRQMILPDIGAEGQQRLKAAKVLIVGVGGLGSPAALYLAAAGVGTIGLADADQVSLSNLQRQVIYSTDDVGKYKVDIAAQRLRASNSNVEIKSYHNAISFDNVLDIFNDYDVILDGTDNFAAHYLINDAAILARKPLVWGNVERFSGQVGAVLPLQTACYRCLYPSPPPPGVALSCAEIGVMGTVPGMIGTLQATEILKIILQIGELLADRILRVNSLTGQFKEIKVTRNQDCAICGNQPAITNLMMPVQACAIMEITANELQDKIQASSAPFLLDVRSPDEFAVNKISGAYLIPLPLLSQRLHEIPINQEVIVYCHSGQRSAQAAEELQKHGYRARALKGGILAMQAAGHYA